MFTWKCNICNYANDNTVFYWKRPKPDKKKPLNGFYDSTPMVS